MIEISRISSSINGQNLFNTPIIQYYNTKICTMDIVINNTPTILQYYNTEICTMDTVINNTPTK